MEKAFKLDFINDKTGRFKFSQTLRYRGQEKLLRVIDSKELGDLVPDPLCLKRQGAFPVP